MSQSRYQFAIVLCVALIGLSLSFYLYSALQHWEQAEFEKSFSTKAKDHV